jgi:hypothetical protein
MAYPSTIPCVCIEPMIIHNARYLTRAIHEERPAYSNIHALEPEAVKNTSDSRIASSFSVQFLCVFLFLGIFDRELLTPIEVHYDTKDIFTVLTEAQRKVLHGPCRGLQSSPLNTCR